MNEIAQRGSSDRLAVFDLDGTVTRRDTFVPYLRGWLKRHPDRARHRALPSAIGRYLAGNDDRGRLKSDLIRIYMSGAVRADVEAWSGEFVAGLGDEALLPGAIAAIERHRAAGDRLVLLSASVDLYVPLIGSQLGFHESVCTGIAWQDGRLEGSLTTPNRRGTEKLRCIELLRQRHPGLFIAAYGNSRSDLAHLAAVDRPCLVNGAFRARRAAERLGIPTADWRNKPADRPVQSS